MHDVSSPSFWSALYQAGDTGWDKGRCTPPIARMLREGHVPSTSQIAVIGCGRGHEALEAARQGYRVTAIDFAPEAIEAVKVNARQQGLELQAVEADVFDLAKRWPEHFDAILEHTCLCAIDPHRRDEYVSAVAGALQPQGLLFGLFYACDKPTSPPYTIDVPEVQARFSPRFEFLRLCTAVDSFEHRAGNELEFVARKRPVGDAASVVRTATDAGSVRSESANLVTAYLAGVTSLEQAVRGLTTAELRAHPVTGTWSTLEVLCHVADSEALFAERMKRVLAEDRPPLLFADPDQYAAALAYNDRVADVELLLIRSVRQQMARILQSQSESAWSRIGVHNTAGEQTLEQLVRKAVDHLEHHLSFIRAKREALEGGGTRSGPVR